MTQIVSILHTTHSFQYTSTPAVRYQSVQLRAARSHSIRHSRTRMRACMMLRFSLSADVLPPAYVGRMSRPISSITARSCPYLLAGRAAVDGGGAATIEPVSAAILAADGGGVPSDSGSLTTDRGVSGLLGAIGVPGPELLDSMMTSSSITVATALFIAFGQKLFYPSLMRAIY